MLIESHEENSLSTEERVLRGRYKIIDSISNDTGFGITYLAEDLDLPDNHKCVVKQLNRQRFNELISENSDEFQKIVDLFYRESESLYTLGNHSQIPCLFARFEENDEYYLVQEHIDGYNLCNEITSDRGELLNEQETIKILKEIIEILVFVHDNNCVHRDIKPANIMRRREDEKLVLIDFGAVKKIVSEINTAINLSQNENDLPTVIGTPPYAPSEQLNTEKPIIGYFNDIHAVGIIGIKALTGSNSINNWRSNSNVKVSDDLAIILDRMTHRNYQQRYQNAREALQALKEIEKSMITKFMIWFFTGK